MLRNALILCSFGVVFCFASFGQALSITPSSIAVSTGARQAAVNQQEAVLASSFGVNNFAFTVSTAEGGEWLSAKAESQEFPTLLRLSIDSSKLSEGKYRGNVRIVIFTSIGERYVDDLRVDLTVQAPATIQANPPALNYTPTGSTITGGSLTISSSRVGLPFTISTPANAPWLSASPLTGVTPAIVSVSADVTSLPPGASTSALTIASAGLVSQAVPVTISVAPPQLSVGTAQLDLAADSNPVVSGIVPVKNLGGGSLNFSVATTTTTDEPWLSVTTGARTVKASETTNLTVVANGAILQPGTYKGSVILTGAGVGDRAEIPVTLRLARNVPVLSVCAAPLVVSATTNGASVTRSLTISNPGTGTLAWVATPGVPWLTVSPASGSVAPRGTTTISLSFSPARLAAGRYSGTLNISATGADNSPQAIPVSLTVAAASSPTLDQEAISPLKSAGVASADCVPRQIAVIAINPQNGFSVTVGEPLAVELRVADDCGNLLSNLRIAVSSNSSQVINVTSVGNGIYRGTWLPSTTGTTVLSFLAVSLTGANVIAGQTSVSGTVRSPIPDTVPLVAPNGVVNAASFTSGPLAPGSVFSLFGSNLIDACQPASATSLPLPTVLSGTTVLAGGIPIPLFYAGQNQINGQIPFDAIPNTQIQLTVRRGTSLSTPYSIAIATAQPGLLTLDQSGTGAGAILSSNFGVVSKSNPARRGSVIVVFGVGFGPVTPVPPPGASSFTQVSKMVNPATLTIGGVSAEILFAGLSPGLVGLYQLNAIVPPAVTPGDAVPVVVTVAGQKSSPVSVAVQ